MTPKAHILIVEDRDALRRLMHRALSGEGYRVTAAADVSEAKRCLAAPDFDLVFSDLKLPDGSGLDVLALCRQVLPEVPVVMLTAFGTITTAVEAMKLGAVDFLEKPVELEDLFTMVEALAQHRDLPPLFQPEGAPPVVGRHPQLMAALRLLKKVATTESTVLLTGESGTGKGLFAQCLHAISPRRDQPFVAVNCAAIPETLMENELFGHEKGAFTGATRRQQGRFGLAQGGTIFLDEIGELDLAVQGKVLRVLEDRTYERVGGGRPLKADVRIVAATNRDLRGMVRGGEFRQDLFYRLDVFPIELPPLRQRATDIPLLANHLLQSIAARLKLPVPTLTTSAGELLTAQGWPGNVRQLANLLERGIILCEGGELTAADLQSFVETSEQNDTTPTGGEESQVREALLSSGGDKRQAARALGWSYSTLQRRVRRFDLEGFPKYRR